MHLVTSIFEWNDKDSNMMDRHNNRLGACIGSQVESFSEIEPAVRKAVLSGKVDARDRDQVTWLPEAKWRDGRLW